MPKELNWKYDLEEYIRQGEPGKAEKSAAWQTAIGLQDVDGLKTSDYLIERIELIWRLLLKRLISYLPGSLRSCPRRLSSFPRRS